MMDTKLTRLEILHQKRREQEKLFRFLQCSCRWSFIAYLAFFVVGMVLVAIEKSGVCPPGSHSFAVPLWSICWWRKGFFVVSVLSWAYCMVMFPVRLKIAAELGKETPKMFQLKSDS